MSVDDACEAIYDFICDMDWTASYYPYQNYYPLAIFVAEQLMSKIACSDKDPIQTAEDFREELRFYAENNLHTRRMFDIYENAVGNIIECYLTCYGSSEV